MSGGRQEGRRRGAGGRSALVRLADDLAVEPEVIPPARVDAIELGVDAPDVGVFADEPVAARLENLPQRDIRKVLERLDDGPTSLVPGPECDRKLAHVVKCKANSLTPGKAANTPTFGGRSRTAHSEQSSPA